MSLDSILKTLQEWGAFGALALFVWALFQRVIVWGYQLREAEARAASEQARAERAEAQLRAVLDLAGRQTHAAERIVGVIEHTGEPGR